MLKLRNRLVGVLLLKCNNQRELRIEKKGKHSKQHEQSGEEK